MPRLALSVLFLWLVSTVVAQSEKAPFGSYTYTVPAGWKVSVGNTLLTFTCDTQPVLKGARIEVQKDEPLAGDFEVWYGRKWDAIRYGRAAQKTTELEKVSQDGATGLVRSIIYSSNDFELVLAFAVNGRAMLIRAKMTSQEQIAPVQEAVVKMIDSVAVGSVSKPPTKPEEKPTPPVQKPPAEKPPTEKPATVPTTKPTKPATQPTPITQTTLEEVDLDALKVNPGLALPGGSPEEAAKLLAKQYLTDSAAGFDALTIAVRASGYSIWKQGRKPVAQPLTAQRTGIAFSEDDLAIYYGMSRGGVRIRMDVFADTLSRIGYRHFGSWKWQTGFYEGMQAGLASKNPAVRFYSLFLAELFKQSSGASITRQDQWSDVSVDPAVLLLIFHPLTETMNYHWSLLKPALTKKNVNFKTPLAEIQSPALYASLPGFGSPLQTAVPGWVEDGGVGTANTLNNLGAEKAFDALTGKALDLFGDGKLSPNGLANLFKALDSLKKLNEMAGKWASIINLVSSITKFITTYAAMEAKFDVEGGQPLVRTKSRNAGEVKKVKITLNMNSSRIQNVMKQIRPYLAPFGFDIDQPPAGPMSGVEVSWTMLNAQGLDTPVWYKGSNIRRVVTNDKGEAEVDVEGRPQIKDLSKHPVRPYIRRQDIGVTISVKPAEIKQDVVDAVFGGIGILTMGGGSAATGTLSNVAGKAGTAGGVLGPVMELLYRVDWAYKGFKLNVRDWRTEALLVDFNLSVEGSGMTMANGKGRKVRVMHNMSIGAAASGESVNLYPTGEMMSDGEASRLLGAGKTATTNKYSTDQPTPIAYAINDRWDWDGEMYVGDCIDYKIVKVKDWETWKGPLRGEGFDPAKYSKVTFTLAQNKDMRKGWLNLGFFRGHVIKEYSRSKSESTTVPFFQGTGIEEWVKEFPVDVSVLEERKLEGAENEPDFIFFEAHGTATKSDKWFGIPVVGTATWTITQVVASGPTVHLLTSRMALGRNFVRKSFGKAYEAADQVIAEKEALERSKAAFRGLTYGLAG